MRQLPPRQDLPEDVSNHLSQETAAIKRAANPKEEAARRYAKARAMKAPGDKWFKDVIDALRNLAGSGECCMYCSRNESSQVEHFYPKGIYPERAMTWENFLWACGICNHQKGEQFPLDYLLINPLDENVWMFFFIDEYGNLTPRWRTDLDDFDPRAAKTREVLGLDGQILQESRQARLLDLRKRVADSLRLFRLGDLDQEALRERLEEWLKQPFQPDVADYFFNGPGRSDSPFTEYLSLLD